MKRSPRFRCAVPLLFAASLFFSGAVAHPQAAPSDSANTAVSAQPEAGKPASSAKPAEESEEQQIEGFRHSGAVQAIARVLHVDVETAAKIFEDLNSGILIAVIVIFLLKVLPKAFRGRTATIQKQLIEARSATEDANERLSAVEKRLSKLDDEIASIVRQTESDSVQDEARIKQSLEDERQRIIQSAEQEIDAAGAAAQRQLKQFAAELAIERAIQDIRLTPETDRLLIEDFGQSLTAEAGKRGRN